ncbi:MAG: hypothetical protein Q9218_003900 [Villophora microphyllina]
MSRYSLLPLGILLFSILLLLVSIYYDGVAPSGHTKRSSLINLRFSIEDLLAANVPTSPSKSIGLPFGRQYVTLNLSIPVVDSTLIKRAPSREPKAWPDLKCNGGALLEKIQAAFQGTTPPGRELPSSELDNGWEKSTDIAGEDMSMLGRYWSSVFDDLYPDFKGKQLDVKPINVQQTGKYTTDEGTLITIPTRAFSFAAYFPDFKWIVATNSLSPSNVIDDRNTPPGISKEDRNKQLPRLNKLSDILWLNWNTVSQNPKELRYIGRSHIINPQTKLIMDYLFLRDSPQKSMATDIRWPGLEYKGESNELKVLLATPNGLAIAYILIDHSYELKRRDELTRRQLRVNIFYVDRRYYMLWDIEAQSPRGQSTRTTAVASATDMANMARIAIEVS